ncbi:MAG: hypothetical protein ACOYM3_09250 [Terrimicrobiaceae bacterium]
MISGVATRPGSCPPIRKYVSTGLKLAGLISVLGFVFLLVALSRNGLGSRDQPFFLIPLEENPEAPSLRNKAFLNFRQVETKGGINHHTMLLQSDAGDWLLTAPTISILLVSNWKVGEVISGKMVFTDRLSGKETARYTVRKGDLIRENRKLVFHRKKSAGDVAPAKEQNVRLELVSHGAPDLVLVGQFTEDAPLSDALWVPGISWNGKSGVASLCGWFGSGAQVEAFSKARLLAYTWGFGAGSGRIVYSVIAVSAVIWLLGLLALLRPGPLGTLLPENPATAAGAGLLFLSIGLVYAVLFPPFQCADEADHFLNYAGLNSRDDLARDALTLANTGHFERIKLRADERFSSADVGSPMSGPWAPHIEEHGLNRSSVARTAWSFAGGIFSTGHSGTALLGLRFYHVLFVSLCLGLSLALAGRGLAEEKVSALMAAPALLTPSLAFFSMGVSNYPFLVGGYVIQSIALGSLWAQPANKQQGHRLAVATGVLIGCGLILAVGSADNGLFSLGFWAILIPGYWLLKGVHSDELRDEIRKCGFFSAALVASLLCGWLMIGLAAGDFHILPPAMTAFIERAVTVSFLKDAGAQALVFLGFVVPVILLSFAMLSMGARLRHAPGQRIGREAIILILFLAALFVLLGKSSRIPDFSTTPLVEYAIRVTYSFFEGFGPGMSDWLVTQSFWGEFGWLDTPMPVLLNNILRYGAGLGLLLLFFSVLRSNRYFAGAGFLLTTLAALSAFLTCIAAGYYFVHYGVNGRYLIGPYLLILATAYEGYRRLLAGGQRSSPDQRTVNALLCLVCIGVQTAAWGTILNRYF